MMGRTDYMCSILLSRTKEKSIQKGTWDIQKSPQQQRSDPGLLDIASQTPHALSLSYLCTDLSGNDAENWVQKDTFLKKRETQCVEKRLFGS